MSEHLQPNSTSKNPKKLDFWMFVGLLDLRTLKVLNQIKLPSKIINGKP
jgi:hypothetical protein